MSPSVGRRLRAVLEPSPVGNAGLILLVIGALFAADTFLVKVVRADSKLEAARSFEQGATLMRSGDYGGAIDRIENALTIERDNRDYKRTLAEAELGAGRLAGAEEDLTELLQTNPADGRASLMLARVLEKEGHDEDAISYFHRAIYGQWSVDSTGNRLKTRFELIDLLAKRNSKEELLAELLVVQDEAPTDMTTRLRIGRLFLAAGSPVRAADVFRSVLHETPQNEAALVGLGDAEFAGANYRAAEKDFAAAIRFAPEDHTAQQRLDLANQVLTLDPAVRGLGAEERFRRSRELLNLALEDVEQCLGPTPPPGAQQLLEEARKTLSERVRSSREEEAFESGLDLAEQIWQLRKTACKSPTGSNTPVDLVLAKLAQ